MARSRINHTLLFLLAFHSGLGLCQNGWSETSGTERLKERVTEFYTAIQMNQWDKAAECVTEKSRSNFANVPKGKINGFRISEIKMEEEGKSAIVEVAIKVMMPGVLRLVEMPRSTRWKFEAADWFNDIDDPPPGLSEKFEEYHRRQEARLKKSPNSPVPPLEVKFDRDLIDFGIVAKGKNLTLSFPFTNLSSQAIKIEKIYLQPEFMKDSTKKVVFKPGEKGEVVIQVDTSVLILDVDQTIFVEFQPINEMVALRVKGKVFEAKDLADYKPK